MQSLVYSSKRNNPITDSIRVAAKFGKRHDHVLRDIRQIRSDLGDLPKFGEMFFETKYQDSRGVSSPMFIMTKKGFSLLALRFRGKKAMAFQLEYIEEFERMEKMLQTIADTELKIQLSKKYFYKSEYIDSTGRKPAVSRLTKLSSEPGQKFK